MKLFLSIFLLAFFHTNLSAIEAKDINPYCFYCLFNINNNDDCQEFLTDPESGRRAVDVTGECKDMPNPYFQSEDYNYNGDYIINLATQKDDELYAFIHDHPGGTGRFSEFSVYKFKNDLLSSKYIIDRGGDRAFGGVGFEKYENNEILYKKYDTGEYLGVDYICPRCFLFEKNYSYNIDTGVNKLISIKLRRDTGFIENPDEENKCFAQIYREFGDKYNNILTPKQLKDLSYKRINKCILPKEKHK